MRHKLRVRLRSLRTMIDQPLWMRRIAAGCPRRLLLALLLAPLGAWGVGSFVLTLCISYLETQEQMSNIASVLWVPIYSVIMLPVAAFPIIGVSLFAHCTLAVLGLRRGFFYVLTGTLIGLAFGAMQENCERGLRQGSECSRWEFPDLFFLAAMPGFGAALAFWAKLRPDRTRNRKRRGDRTAQFTGQDGTPRGGYPAVQPGPDGWRRRRFTRCFW